MGLVISIESSVRLQHGSWLSATSNVLIAKRSSPALAFLSSPSVAVP